MRINLKILNILEDRKAGWISLKNKHNLMTKDEVNKAFINRNEGKERNLIEERNKIIQGTEKAEKKRKKENKQTIQLQKRIKLQ